MGNLIFSDASTSTAAADPNIGALANLLCHQILNQEQYQHVERIWQAWQAISSKLGRFDGKNITQFIKIYEQIMEDNGVKSNVIMKNFDKFLELKLWECINELQNKNDETWQTFKTTLKEEYFIEDDDRVTKQTFLKWIRQKNKGLNAPSLLQEFEKRFDQLSACNQTSLEREKVELFVEATDLILQKSLVKDLEDPKGKLGLTSTWKKVPDLISLIVKCQKRSDKLNVVVKEKEPEAPPSTSGSKSKQEEMLENVTK